MAVLQAAEGCSNHQREEVSLVVLRLPSNHHKQQLRPSHKPSKRPASALEAAQHRHQQQYQARTPSEQRRQRQQHQHQRLPPPLLPVASLVLLLRPRLRSSSNSNRDNNNNSQRRPPLPQPLRPNRPFPLADWPRLEGQRRLLLPPLRQAAQLWPPLVAALQMPQVSPLRHGHW